MKQLSYIVFFIIFFIIAAGNIKRFIIDPIIKLISKKDVNDSNSNIPLSILIFIILVLIGIGGGAILTNIIN